MKKILLAIALLMGSFALRAQTQFETTTGDEGKVFKGLISRSVLEKEPSFTWYAENVKDYTPPPFVADQLKFNKDSIQFIVFMGTWCSDSHFIIPKFYQLLDAAGFPSDRVSLIGVDHDKKTLAGLSESLGITNVPTIIVMKHGKEMGRVIEYGKSGSFDKDLGEILARK